MMEENKSQLMEVASGHIYHPRLADHYGEIYEILPDEAVRALNKLLWRVYRREIRVYDFERQAAALNLPKFQEEILPGILRYDLMPLADYLGFRIQDYLHHLRAADLKNFKAIDLAEWITKLNAERRLGFSAVDQKKVFNILAQYLRGAKDGEETAELISHPANLGGIGLNPDFAKEIAKKFKDDIDDAFGNDQFITEQPLDPQLIEKVKAKMEEEEFFRSHQVKVKEQASGEKEQRTKNPAPEPQYYSKAEYGARQVRYGASKEQETMKSVSQVSKGGRNLDAPTVSVKTAEPFRPAIETYEAEAGKIIQQAGLKLVPELERRLKIVVISRLKDIRKLPELRERLVSSPAESGIGLKSEEAEKIIKLAEEGRTKIMRAVPVALSVIPSLSADEAGRVEGSLSQKQEIPPLSASWRIGRNDKQVQSQKSKVESPKPIQTPKPVADSRKLTAESRPQPPRPVTMQMEDNFAPRTSSDIKRSIPRAIKIVPQLEDRPKVELTTPPSPIKPPQTMAIPQTPSGKAKIEDVSYMPRLMGPLEELKEMTLLDFRRLSPKVKVSTDKISAKIELLGQEGYEQRTRGIQGWQRSPLNKMYMGLLGESLRTGKPVSQIIEEKQKRNEETLKPEEFRAIVELNRSLKV